jgi:hypothetical protein
VTLPALQVLAFPASYRIVSADLAPHELIADIASYTDYEAVLEVIALSGADVVDVIGQPALVPPTEWPTGPGAAWALLAFTKPAKPSRFTDGTFGIWYAGEEYDTAVAETRYHQERLMRQWGEPPQDIEKQALFAQLSGPAVDARQLQTTDPARYVALHDPNPANYPAAQAFGLTSQRSPAALMVYHSVRRAAAGDPGRTCIGALRANAIFGASPRVRTTYQWDGHVVSVGSPTYIW